MTQQPVRKTFCTFSPDWLPGVGSIGHFCRLHDRSYTRGGSRAVRLAADRRLARRILEQGRDQGHDWLGAFWSRLYYWGTRAFGWTRFNEH